MRWRGTSPAGLALALAAGTGLWAQQLPLVTIENFPAVSRGPIGRALAEAQAHPGDPERVGHLGMVLQAWEQFETAASVYTLARALERRYDWYNTWKP